MVIKKADRLMGIRYWAQHYHYRVPRFEVFKYVGCNQHLGVHYFQSVREKTIIGRSFYQLNQHGFKPFCLDWRQIQEYVDTLPEPPTPAA